NPPQPTGERAAPRGRASPSRYAPTGGSMVASLRERFAHSQRWVVHLGICVLASAGLVATLAPMGAAASARPAAPTARSFSSVAQNYTIRYYPRFMTYVQQSLGGFNRLAGPDRVGPLYGYVVSINVDTLYASFFLDVSQGPEIFTIPSTDVTYSLLTLDVFGNVFTTNIKAQTPGTYGLVSKDWKGKLPPGVTKIKVPYPVTTWIIRADKYSSTGQNQVHQAGVFRRTLRLASLPDYESKPRSGATQIVPQAAFALRMKAVADDAVRFHTTHFFRVLQAALSSYATAPLSESDHQLSSSFNEL